MLVSRGNKRSWGRVADYQVSNPESFIAEVTEELRRDRLYALFRKWGWLAALLVVLVVGLAAWREWDAGNRKARAQALGDALLDIEKLASSDARRDAFAELYESGIDPDAQSIARIYQAGLLSEDGDDDGAILALSRVSSDTSVSEIYRDLALLKSVVYSAADADSDQTLTALEQLSVPGRPFRLLALEYKAQYLVGSHGDLQEDARGEAIKIMQTLLQDSQITPEQAERVGLFLAAIGGTASAVQTDEE